MPRLELRRAETLRTGFFWSFVTESSVVSVGADLVTCEATLRDDGVDGRAIAMATAVFLRTDRSVAR